MAPGLRRHQALMSGYISRCRPGVTAPPAWRQSCLDLATRAWPQSRGTRRVTRTAVRPRLSNEGHIKVRAWACRRTFASSSFRFTSLSRSGSCHHFVSW